MLAFLIAIVCGISFGTFTGLIPGIHVNLIAALVTTYLGYLLGWADPLTLSVFLVSMAITHSFLDAIPSIYLGAPDESLADAALPGHKLYLEGRAYTAVILTLIGSLTSLIVSALFAYPAMKIIMLLYPILRPWTAYLLLLVLIWLISRSEEKRSVLLIIFLSSLMGLIVLNAELEHALFPMLSGLFGTSTLLLSLKDEQRKRDQVQDATIEVPTHPILIAITSTIGGFIAAFLPGLGSAQAGTMSQSFSKISSNEGILILLGGINTVNFLLSLSTLMAIDKARNGIIVAISEFLRYDSTAIVILLLSCVIAGGLACLLAMKIASLGLHIIDKVPQRTLTLTVLGLITILVPLLSGPRGILIYLTATAIGLLPPLMRIPRSFCMCCLMVPVITYLI